MFKNLKLGIKLGTAFGLLLLLACGLGIMAIINLNSIKLESSKLADEYAPEVEVANNVERDSMMTMYNIRGYGFTEEKKFLDTGKEHLKDVNANMAKAEDLADRAKHLTKLKGAVADVKANVNQY